MYIFMFILYIITLAIVYDKRTGSGSKSWLNKLVITGTSKTGIYT